MLKTKQITIPELDFVARPKWAKSYIVCFLVLITMLLGVFVLVARQYQHLQRLQLNYQTLQEMQSQQRVLEPKLDPAEEKVILEKTNQLKKVNATLRQDLQLFSLLESCVNQDWAFLSIKPNLSTQETNLTIETRDINTLNKGMECLEGTQAFSQVKLISQQRVMDDPLKPIRADLTTQ